MGSPIWFTEEEGGVCVALRHKGRSQTTQGDEGTIGQHLRLGVWAAILPSALVTER
jgi:hypothetical protein